MLTVFMNKILIRGSADVTILLVSDMSACGFAVVDSWRLVCFSRIDKDLHKISCLIKKHDLAP